MPTRSPLDHLDDHRDTPRLLAITPPPGHAKHRPEPYGRMLHGVDGSAQIVDQIIQAELGCIARFVFAHFAN